MMLRHIGAVLEWMNDGACVGMNPDLFFPGKGESTREAKAACGKCPVQRECLDYAMENGEHFGIYGGTSERERKQIRRRRALARRKQNVA